MELIDLVGERKFSGIETGSMPAPDDMWTCFFECEYVKFTLDGVHYLAVENPEDGWRSFCEELQIVDTAPRFQFNPVKVRCTMKQDDDLWKKDVLVLTDAVTNGVVLEVGTENVGDYYPCCHFEYHPENMACNK